MTVLGTGATIDPLLDDRFLTTESAPLTDPRSAEPGPGSWNITDTANNLSISGNNLIGAGTDSVGDPSLYDANNYASASNAGLSMFAKIIPKATSRWYVGFDNDAVAGFPVISWFTLSGNFRISLVGGAITGNIFGYTADVTYDIAVVYTGSLVFWLAKFNNEWLLYWVDDNMYTDAYPAISAFSGACDFDTTRVLKFLAYFNATSALEAFDVSGTISAGDTQDTGFSDFVMRFSVPNITTTRRISMRRTDDNNRYFIRVDDTSGDLDLVEVDGGTATQVSSSAGAVTGAATITAFVDGDNIRVFVDNTIEIDYSNATKHQAATGAKSEDAGVTDWSAYNHPRDISQANSLLNVAAL